MASKRCKAKTQSGDRCRNDAVDGSVYCAVHKRKPAASKRTPAKSSRSSSSSSSSRSRDKRCEATTASGSRCRNKAVDGSDFCGVHAETKASTSRRTSRKSSKSSSPGRCDATTASGSRCRNKAVEGSDFCAVHSKAKSSSKSASRSTSSRSGGRCTATTQAGKRCRNDALDGMDLCGVHRQGAGNDDLLEELAKMVESIQGKKSRKKYQAPDFSGPALLKLILEFLAGGGTSRNSALDALMGIAGFVGGDKDLAQPSAPQSTPKSDHRVDSDSDGVSLVIPGLAPASSSASLSSAVGLNLAASTGRMTPLEALWYLLNYVRDNRDTAAAAVREQLAEILDRLDVRSILP